MYGSTGDDMRLSRDMLCVILLTLALHSRKFVRVCSTLPMVLCFRMWSLHGASVLLLSFPLLTVSAFVALVLILILRYSTRILITVVHERL